MLLKFFVTFSFNSQNFPFVLFFNNFLALSLWSSSILEPLPQIRQEIPFLLSFFLNYLLLFIFFETGFLCVALAVLELPL